jgi:hypothetical protein
LQARLSITDNASNSLRKLLLESCNLHTILDCPGGTFLGAGVKTVVLFFEKGAPNVLPRMMAYWAKSICVIFRITKKPFQPY